MTASPLLTAEEAGKILRKGPFWVLKQCREGKLRASKVGGTWLIDPQAINEFVAERMNRPAPEATPRRRKQRRAS